MKKKFARCLSIKKRLVISGQPGFTLIEVLVAVALMATMGVGFVSAMITGTNSTGVVEKKVDIDNLARAQMEYTKGCQYKAVGDGGYLTIDDPTVDPEYRVTLPSDYDILVEQTAVDETDPPYIQMITVTIKRGSDTLLELQGYKVNRWQRN
ncbi:MAG: type II secretion system protein [Dehalococcoidia bacterium]|nr:type II secretion system protein [Dehalococcoidia bacterium]